MSKVLAIGETVFDIIFRHRQPVAARPGGSMLNSAVSLGRAGIPVQMITELGDDETGRLVLDFLKENGVATSYIKPVAGFKTTVSLAFLDEKGNANYSFYKNYPNDRLNIHWPEVTKGDVILFGSYYSLMPGIRQKVFEFIKKAKQNGALVFYDPNIRKNHLHELNSLMPFIMENIALADIIRGSDEDFLNLFGLKNDDAIFDLVKNSGCNNLIVSKGENGADLLSGDIRSHAPADKIDIASTIGAGDSFNAGIIFGLLKNGVSVDDLVNITPEKWNELLNFGINFAADVCRGYDNYISEELILKLNG